MKTSKKTKKEKKTNKTQTTYPITYQTKCDFTPYDEEGKFKEPWEGESIEDKCRRVTATSEPIEAVSPMIYTERKEGVKAEHNIRTDKWEVAQSAMTTIAKGMREKREERHNPKQKTDKPGGESEVNAQTNPNS